MSAASESQQSRADAAIERDAYDLEAWQFKLGEARVRHKRQTERGGRERGKGTGKSVCVCVCDRERERERERARFWMFFFRFPSVDNSEYIL
jgi:hypothetical protein